MMVKRVSILMIVLLAFGCGAAFAEVEEGDDSGGVSAAQIGSTSFINAVFASKASTIPGNACSSTADRVYSATEQIFLTVRFFNAVAGDTQRIRIVANAAGQVVIGPITTTAVSTVGNRIACEPVTLPPGTYFYAAAIFTPTGMLVSTDVYPFVVE